MRSTPSRARTWLDSKIAASISSLPLVLFLISSPSPVSAEEENEAPPDHSLLEHAEEYFQENPPNADPTPVPDFGNADKVVPAWAEGEISTDELVRYGYLSVYDPDELPDEYVPDQSADLDVSSYMPFILSQVDEASEETREWVLDELTPAAPESMNQDELSTLESGSDCGESEEVADVVFTCVTISQNFMVWYNIGFSDGIPGEDTNGNGRPDAIDTIIDSLEAGYRTYTGRGFDHPDNGATGRISVFLGLAPRGQAFVSPVSLGPLSSPNPIAMSANPAQRADGGENKDRYNYLPRHELFHVFQYYYIPDPTAVLPSVNWWMEATAEWATRESIRSGAGDRMYAGTLGDFLNHPGLALNAYEGLGSGRQYGSFIVASYFTEAVSRNFVLDTWRTIKESRNSVEGRVAPIEAIEQVADFYGRDLNDLLLGFAVANYRLDTPSGATFFLGAQDGYEEPHARDFWRTTLDSGSRPPRTEHTISQSVSRSGTPEVAQGGATYVEFTPSSAGGRLTVELDALTGDYSYALLTWTPGAGRPNMAPIDMTRGATRPIRTAELTVTLNQGERATLVIARTDVSTSPSTGPVHWNASLSQAPAGGSKIMVVGDSITHGNEGSHSWRYVLERHLRANGSSVDFVGPRIGTYDIHTDIRNRAILDGNEPPPQQYYPGPSTAAYYNNNFDREHNAMWGWTFADANNTIRRDVADYDADYLLIGLGFNDITWGYSDAAGTVTSARRMIEEAREANPDIRVLISNVVTRTTLPEFEWLNPEIRQYASLLGPAMQSLSTERSPVHVVDISSDFNPNLGAHTWDGVHPNSAGDYFIGAKFADAMHGRFGVGSPYGSLPSNPPDVQLGKVQGVRVGMTDQGFRISWNRVFGASGYLVWTRNVSEGESWRLLPLPVPGDYFHSTWLRTGEVHEFRVAAMRGDQQIGPPSDVASGEAAPRTVPGPANVRVQVDGTNGLVSWDARSSGARGYQVYWIEALGNYPVMRNAYVSGVSTDSYRITGLQPGMTYNVGVSSVNAFGPGIPTGTLNPVVVPGSTTLREEDALDITWEAEDESFLGTAELWDGYPEGVAPTTDAFPQDPQEMESEGAGEERQHIPTGLPARKENQE